MSIDIKMGTEDGMYTHFRDGTGMERDGVWGLLLDVGYHESITIRIHGGGI